jgi:hypothetical protein
MMESGGFELLESRYTHCPSEDVSGKLAVGYVLYLSGTNLTYAHISSQYNHLMLWYTLDDKYQIRFIFYLTTRGELCIIVS